MKYRKISLRKLRQNLTRVKDSLKAGQAYEVFERGKSIGYLIPTDFNIKLEEEEKKNFDPDAIYRKAMEDKHLKWRSFFLDTNILIDLITEREEIIPDLKSFLFELDPSQIFLSTLSIPNTYYIFKIKSGSKLDIRVRNFISTINLVPLNAKIINSTLKSFSNNFEDTLQYYSALSEGCNHILTRDTKAFEKIKKAIPSNIEIIDTLKDLN